ncbi:MAG: hypothetical protein QOK67_10540 [Nitrososphaeraceae archaeon]|nr:hypothetical protein [Nitrososphaeraceae archaeon]
MLIVILFTISYCTANNQQVAIDIAIEIEENRTRGKKNKIKTIMMTIKKYNYIENKSKNEILDPNDNNFSNIFFYINELVIPNSL